MQREQSVQRDPGLRVTDTLREHQCGESREGWRGNQTDKGSGSVPPLPMRSHTQMALRSHMKGTQVWRLGLTWAFRKDAPSSCVKNGRGQG